MSSGRIRRLATRSIRFRLAAMFVAIFGLTLIAFSALLYEAFVRSHETEFDTALYNHAVDVAQAIDVDLFGGLSVHTDLLAEGGKIFPFSLVRASVQIRDPSGKVIAKSRATGKFELPLSPGDLRELKEQRFSFRTVNIEKNLPYRMISVLIDKPAQPSLILQIAVPMAFLEKERQNLLTFFLIAIPLVLLIASFGGLYLSRRALAPVSAIIDKAKSIGADQLSVRVPIPVVDDELRQLALTLNDLLDRLQKAFESQERFVADASHQLKTPLAILRGELDLIQSRPRSADEVSNFVLSAAQEIQYLSRIVEDLLMLARVDAGKASLSIRPVRMDEIALEVISRKEKFAALKKIRLLPNLNGTQFEVQGDPDLLHCMLENLVENAIKFSPENSQVELNVSEAPGEVLLSVKDQGPGVPPELQEKLFERFYRADSTRDHAAGAGLGLHIALRIAEAHRGTIELQSEPGHGAVFTARIETNHPASA